MTRIFTSLFLFICLFSNSLSAQFVTDTVVGKSYMMHNLRYPDYCLGEAKGRMYFLARARDNDDPSMGDSILIDVINSTTMNFIAHKTICLSKLDKKRNKKGEYFKSYNINNVLINDSGIHVIAYKYNPYDFQNIYYRFLLDTAFKFIEGTCDEFLKVKDSKIAENASEHRYFDRLSYSLDSLSACDFYATPIQATDSSEFTMILNSYSYDFGNLTIEQRRLSRSFKDAKFGKIKQSIFFNKFKMVALLYLSDTLLTNETDFIKNNDIQYFKYTYLIDVDFKQKTMNLIPLNFSGNDLENPVIEPRSKSEISVYAYYGVTSEPLIQFPESENLKNFGYTYRQMDNTFRLFKRKGFFNINYNAIKGSMRNRIICEFDELYVNSIMKAYDNIKVNELTLYDCIETKNGVALVNLVEGIIRDPQIKTVSMYYNITSIENKKIKFSKNIPFNFYYHNYLDLSPKLYTDTSRIGFNLITVNQHLTNNLNDPTLRVIDFKNLLYSYRFSNTGDINFSSLEVMSLTSNLNYLSTSSMSQNSKQTSQFLYFVTNNINKKKGISMNNNLSITFKKIIFH